VSHLPKYIVYLKRDAVTYYKYINGIVTTTGTPYAIPTLPIGWKDTQIRWVRNVKYHGISRTLSTPYQFVREAAEILRKVKYTEGGEGRCTMVIMMRNEDWTYSQLYSGEIDFSTSKDGVVVFKANILDNSIESKIKANENTPYEIPVNDTTGTITLTGLMLESKANFITIAGSNINGVIKNAFTFQEGDYTVTQNMGQGIDTNLGGGYDIVGNFWTIPMYDQNSYLIEALRTMDVRCTFNQRFVVEKAGGGSVSVKVQFLVVNKDREVTAADGPPASVPITADGITEKIMGGGTSYFTINPGDRVYLAAKIIVNSGSPDYSLSYDGNGDSPTSAPNYWAKVESRWQYETTTHYAIRHCDAYDELMKKVVGSSTIVSYSAYLRSTAQHEDNIPYMNFLLPGDSIRRLPDAKLKVTLSDFFQDATGRACLGMGPDNTGTIRMEPFKYWYDKDIIIADLGDITDPDAELEDANDIIYDNIKVGQPEQTYDNINGRYEYNQESRFRGPVTRVSNELDLTGKFRRDSFGIEAQRQNLSGKTTTDSSSDNDTFIVCTRLIAGFLVQRRPLFSSGATASGIPYVEQGYEYDLTPKRDLLRNKPRLAASYFLRNGQTITFQTTDKNTELQVMFEGGRPNIVEKANLAVSDLGTPYCLPCNFRFKARSPKNLLYLMDLYSRGCFKFRWKGVNLKGYPMDVGLNLSTNGEYDFWLRLTEDSDISKLHK